VKSEYSVPKRIAIYVLPLLATAALYLIGSTLRFEHICEEGMEPGVVAGQKKNGPGAYCFWHRSLLIAAYYFRNLGITTLISRSFDGELTTRTTELLGFKPARGSSSRGGVGGLIAMEAAWREGRIAAFTSDGPRGPRYVAKPGVAALAERTGDHVTAFYLLPQRAWELPSWDRMLVPKPFSRVVITWAKTAPVSDAEAAMPEVQAALNRCVEMAEQHWAGQK
jgi:lysophospholipid acyltransferase (LPLAT)-like uncharacterized protein